MYQAQPPLEFIQPKYNPWFLRLAHLMLPLWMRSQTALTTVEAENVEVLTDLYSQFQAGKIRFMLAFRHPKIDDPVALGYFFARIVPEVARQQKIKFTKPIHAHFIYDRGIPLWAGEYVAWIAQNLAGTPIQRGKADWTGLKSARDLFANGMFPMAAAPEGATNGLSEIVSPLEPGIAQMGFWCAEDLQKAGRSEEVLILPVGIKYSYVENPWKAIANLLTELELKSGLPNFSQAAGVDGEASDLLYMRLLRLADHLLTIMENFYNKFYRCQLASNGEMPRDPNQAIAMRLQAVLNEILKVAEAYFNLQPKGSLTDRCRRVEQAGWNCIFREEFKDIKSLSAVEKGLGDRIADEANMHMWHMRLVESFVAVTGEYVRENPSPERFSETLLILWQMVARITGENTSKRPDLGKQKAKITIGQPICVSERYSTYKGNRQGAKQAVADLTKDMQIALEKLI
ncbi:1-acyl-sn-glycerol-3-phosphate acyltransferase [Calothrix sp. UHCC 0171]|uniref:1-acyl-sn-glycerol-3-phosphate acyltransferase n=1 Tax=Calothrix sp. UHCC 0171 TaxID=3110245 RepID=UPI002B1FDB84|nr:1-acyl-sn-glycerol-3-phosphate acyltransferase [Calothrix sp. UHCC 0171]MEA5570847.1 1-acyl-sn-glycerol-3-phosphate acyltransferase [Calothrix sp. UHCC 0171]